MIDTYIINLPRDIVRRDYVIGLLAPYDFLSINLVSAIEGKCLSDEELDSNFDIVESYHRYGRKLNRGEIGCTLSHYECYKRILESNHEYALILEDDITIVGELENIKLLTPYMNNEAPTIIFLSGDYWYMRENRIVNNLYLTNVYDAVGSYAYLINKSAARLILGKNPKASCAADNWSLYRSQGVIMKAIRPYLIDANIENFESTINQNYFGENRAEMSFKHCVKAYWLAFVKRCLVHLGHFVSKIRK